MIKYYYAYFGQASYAKGNGSDYTSNTLPHGWISIPKTDGFVPEPGDIAVWGTELSANGHVAIVLSANANSFVSMDQNWPSGSACKQVKHTYTKFWGVIRPNFADQKDTPVDVGDNFYAYLINTATWLHATNDDSGNVSVRSLKYTSDQIWHFEKQGDGSYKITSCKDGRCMEVHNFESANGTNVEMNNWSGNTAQKWFVYGDSGAYKLKAACGDNALDMSGGPEAAQDETNLNMWEDNGSDAQKFSIWKLDQIKDTIRNATVTLEYNSCTYDGKEHTPAVTIKKGDAELKKDTDYKITYVDNENADTAAITVTGTGAYTGKITREFQIKKADQELKVSVKKTEISVGESAQITVTGQGNITYCISPENIITISDTGIIRGKQAGKAVITVRAEENENYNSAEKEITIQVKKSGWQKEEKGWRYHQQTGEPAKSSWKYINKSWYHFNTNGYMQTGWLKLQDTWYYLKTDGAMAADEWVDNGKYYVDINGRWA